MNIIEEGEKHERRLQHSPYQPENRIRPQSRRLSRRARPSLPRSIRLQQNCLRQPGDAFAYGRLAGRQRRKIGHGVDPGQSVHTQRRRPLLGSKRLHLAIIQSTIMYSLSPKAQPWGTFCETKMVYPSFAFGRCRSASYDDVAFFLTKQDLYIC